MTGNIDSHFNGRPQTRRRANADPVARGDDADKRADDAITNLSAYALRLDFEYHQLHERLLELANGDGAATEELRTVVRERDELGAAREAFRRSVAALHDLTRRDARLARADQL
jgi:hypothetical protein